ncbi:MAG: hypothetical protein ACRDOF_09910 [Gaiellaceae bacterium]
MDREAMARNQRRRVIGEAIELELGRETALGEQLEEMVAELEGGRVDEEVLARLTPEDAEIVRVALTGQSPGEETAEDDEDWPDEDWLAAEPDPEVDAQELADEISRLEDEIAQSRRRRDALERYVDALDERADDEG